MLEWKILLLFYYKHSLYCCVYHQWDITLCITTGILILLQALTCLSEAPEGRKTLLNQVELVSLVVSQRDFTKTFPAVTYHPLTCYKWTSFDVYSRWILNLFFNDKKNMGYISSQTERKAKDSDECRAFVGGLFPKKV